MKQRHIFRHFNELQLRLGLSLTAAFVLLAGVSLSAQTAPEEGFVSLFDGKTLDGWHVGDNASLFHVEDGTIVMDCPATNHRPAGQSITDGASSTWKRLALSPTCQPSRVLPSKRLTKADSSNSVGGQGDACRPDKSRREA